MYYWSLFNLDFNYQKPNDDQFNTTLSNVNVILTEEEKTNKFEDLLSENDIRTMKAKYEQSVFGLLEDAHRRHVKIIF